MSYFRNFDILLKKFQNISFLNKKCQDILFTFISKPNYVSSLSEHHFIIISLEHILKKSHSAMPFILSCMVFYL